MPAPEAHLLLSSLGERMGLLFQESALTRAFELVGGHPLLLRRLGSAIHESTLHRTDRKSVNAQDVEKAFKAKKRDLFNQVAWFLEHLARVSPDEERMLRDIANGGAQAYADLWSNDDFRETYAHHLEQYGLLHFENDLPIIALDLIREALKRPIAIEFIEQKKQLKDVIEVIEQAVRIRLRVDLERDTAPDEAVAHVVSAIPSDAKNRPLGRKELIELGNIAGVGAVLDAMNWGDYEILFDKFYDKIEWSGSLVDKPTRIGNIKRAFTQAHLIRHNNDHQIKQLIDERGYNEVYAGFAAMREILGG
ncbi:hypothetical protein [Massilia sp. TWP1-3-3]|uniref:hypothetical protein n=1 Tax=Massilia sp. TWP1-3-3 TaxID=2804573 RepID=UPI003CF36AD5